MSRETAGEDFWGNLSRVDEIRVTTPLANVPNRVPLFRRTAPYIKRAVRLNRGTFGTNFSLQSAILLSS